MSDRNLKRKLSSQEEESDAKKGGFADKKEENMWKFILTMIRDVEAGTLDPPMNPQIRDSVQMWEHMKGETETILSAQELHDFFHLFMLPRLAEANLSVQTKACLYYALQQDVDPNFIEELKEKAEVQISEDNKLIGFRRKVDLVESEGDDMWFSVWPEEKDDKPEEQMGEQTEEQTVSNLSDITFSEDNEWPNLGDEIREIRQDPITSFIIDSYRTTNASSTSNGDLPVIDITLDDFVSPKNSVTDVVESEITSPQERIKTGPAVNIRTKQEPIDSSEAALVPEPALVNEPSNENEDDDEIVFIGTHQGTHVPSHVAVEQNQPEENDQTVTSLQVDVTHVLNRISILEQMRDETVLKLDKESAAMKKLESQLKKVQDELNSHKQESNQKTLKISILESQVRELQESVVQHERKLANVAPSEHCDPNSLELISSSVSAVFDCSSQPFNISPIRNPVSVRSVLLGKTEERNTAQSSSNGPEDDGPPTKKNKTGRKMSPVMKSGNGSKSGESTPVKTDVPKKEQRGSKRKSAEQKQTSTAAVNSTPIKTSSNVASLSELSSSRSTKRASKTPTRYGT